MTKEFDKFVELGMKALNENLVKAPTPEFVFEEYASEPKEEEVVNEDVVKEDDEEYFTDEEILEFAQMEEDELYEFLQEASEGDEEILESLTDLFVDEVFGYEVEELSESVEEARSFSSQLKLNRAKQKFDKQGFGQKTRRISLTGMGKDRTSGKKAIRKPVVKKNTDKIDPTTQVAPKKASEKGKSYRIGGKFANKQKAQADQAASAKQFGAEKGEADKAAARGKREGRRRARRAKANWKAKKKENSFFNRVKRGYKAFKGESIEAFGFSLNESFENTVTFVIECEENVYEADIPQEYSDDLVDLLENIDCLDEALLEAVTKYVWEGEEVEISEPEED